MTRRRLAPILGAFLALALVVTGIGAAVSSPPPTPVGLATPDVAYSQDFDTLASTGTSNVLPQGWSLSETGTSATNNGSYAAGTGSGTGGDTYSFGAASSGERALGTLLSGTLQSTIGAAFTNSTGATVTSLDLAYDGEQWRLGNTGRQDRLDFQYSLDATSLDTGTWTDVDALDFSSVNTGPTTGALDGNTNKTTISSTIGGLAIASGSTFWIRWRDFDIAPGADDGLAVDRFFLTPHTGVVNAQPAITCPTNVTVTQGTAFSRSVSASDADGTVTSIVVDSVTPSSGMAAFSISDLSPATTSGGTATANVNGEASLAPGTYTVRLNAANNEAPPQSGTCTFTVTVNPAPVTLPIGTIQGSVTDTTNGATFDSAYIGQTVMVQGVVTERTYERSSSGADQNGFYLQNTAATADSDPNSSDGIFVFMGSFTSLIGGYVPVVGDEVRLTGRVTEFFHMTELSSASATKIGTGAVTPVVADPPQSAADAARYWERIESMQATVPSDSVVIAPTHLFASTQDTEFYVINPTNPVALRADPYAQRAFRDVHPSDDDPGFNGNGFKLLITDEGIKASNHTAKLTQVHTFQKLAAPLTGGVNFAFSKYSVSVSTQPTVVDGADPSANDPPPAFDRSRAYSIANFNVENLYDYRDDPNDGCDFAGNSGCPGVSPPFDYVPASDAEYQGRSMEIAHQIVGDLHSPDVIAVAEAEDQDICTVESGAMACGTADNRDGQPDDLQELALHIQQIGGPSYAAAFDRDGRDARGIVAAFMYRTDRVELLPASPGDAVLGSSPTVQYRTPGLAYNSDVSNPKALNAVLPTDIETPGDTDGTNVFTRAPQVGHFRISPTTAAGSPSDVWILANHFSSGPDARVGQRREQANYNAAVVQAIEGQEPNAKAMVAGDLNVFPRPDDPFLPDRNSDQLAGLYDAGLHNLYDTVIAENPAAAYSYVFDGQAQDLDHQFVTDSWFDDLEAVHEAHINADWPRVPGSNRGTSDHDPMVSQWALKLDSPPAVDAGGPYDVDEGSSVTLTASADDPDGDPVTYAWDLDGDGTFETPGQSVAYHAGDGPATNTVTAQATDSFGLSSTDTATVTVANVAPTATFSASGPVTAGESVTLSLTNPADPSAADTSAGFTYAFDCGSGYGPFSTANTATCPAPTQGTLEVGGKIMDKDGGVREYRSIVTVNGRSPVVNAGGPYTVDEGGTVTVSATGSDPDGDAITYAWDLDGNGTFETSGQSVAYHAGDGPATKTVTVQATDSTGATATSSATVTVRNVAPTATFHAPSSAIVGVPFTISLTNPSDPSPADVSAGFTYAFDCGDGSGLGSYGPANSTTCRTFRPGPLTVRGAIQDKDGGVTTYTATVNVGVTFDAVCELAKEFAATPKAAQKVCDALAKAEKDAARGKRKKVVKDLIQAAAAVVAETARGNFTPKEAATLLLLISKL